MSWKLDKRAIHASATELLGDVSQISCPHVNLSPYHLTPYDAYIRFIEEAKSIIPREALLQLQPGCDPEIPTEQLLTPSFVCSLAFSRLLRLLSCPQPH
jgi:hypothetical protein